MTHLAYHRALAYGDDQGVGNTPLQRAVRSPRAPMEAPPMPVDQGVGNTPLHEAEYCRAPERNAAPLLVGAYCLLPDRPPTLCFPIRRAPSPWASAAPEVQP